MTPRKRPRQAAWYRAAEASSIGIEIAVAIAAGAIGGYYLERHVTHWSPWTSLIGVFLGIGAAANAVIRISRKLSRVAAEETAERDGDDDRKPG